MKQTVQYLTASLLTTTSMLIHQTVNADEMSILEQKDAITASQNEIQVPGNTDQGLEIPDFTFADTAGNKHALSNYKGKWLIVNYWAIYCPPCRVEVYDLDRFAREHADQAVVLGMDAGGSTNEELDAFKNKFGLTYPLIPSQENTLLGFGIIDAIPTTFVVDPQGFLVNRHVGLITYNDLAHFVKQDVAFDSAASFQRVSINF